MTDQIQLVEEPVESVLLHRDEHVVEIPIDTETLCLEVKTTEVLAEYADAELVQEDVPLTEIVVIAEQGPPGPPGPPGMGQARAERVDYADKRYAYLGYPERICRIDYGVWPPAPRYAAIADLSAAWPTRASLTYI